jgi:hypothetical protein
VSHQQLAVALQHNLQAHASDPPTKSASVIILTVDGCCTCTMAARSCWIGTRSVRHAVFGTAWLLIVRGARPCLKQHIDRRWH